MDLPPSKAPSSLSLPANSYSSKFHNPNRRSSELTDPLRRSFKENPFTKSSTGPSPRKFGPSAPPNTPKDIPTRRRDSISCPRECKEKENKTNPGSSKLHCRPRSLSPSTRTMIPTPTSNNRKNFMSPTISAASKISASPRKKTLSESNNNNQPLQSSVTCSDLRSSSSSVRSLCGTFAEQMEADHKDYLAQRKERISFSREIEEKENRRDLNSKQMQVKLLPTSRNTKHFMSPTVSAASKISASPRKKILTESNGDQTSVTYSDLRSSCSSVNNITGDFATKLHDPKGPVSKKKVAFDPTVRIIPPVVSDPLQENGSFLLDLECSCSGVNNLFESMESSETKSARENGVRASYSNEVTCDSSSDTSSKKESENVEGEDVVNNVSPNLNSSSSDLQPLDADQLILELPCDPKTNSLSPRTTDYCEGEINRNPLDDGFIFDVFLDTEGTNEADFEKLQSEHGNLDSKEMMTTKSAQEKEVVGGEESLRQHFLTNEADFEKLQSEHGDLDSKEMMTTEPAQEKEVVGGEESLRQHFLTNEADFEKLQSEHGDLDSKEMMTTEPAQEKEVVGGEESLRQHFLPNEADFEKLQSQHGNLDSKEMMTTKSAQEKEVAGGKESLKQHFLTSPKWIFTIFIIFIGFSVMLAINPQVRSYSLNKAAGYSEGSVELRGEHLGHCYDFFSNIFGFMSKVKVQHEWGYQYICFQNLTSSDETWCLDKVNAYHELTRKAGDSSYMLTNFEILEHSVQFEEELECEEDSAKDVSEVFDETAEESYAIEANVDQEVESEAHESEGALEGVLVEAENIQDEHGLYSAEWETENQVIKDPTSQPAELRPVLDQMESGQDLTDGGSESKVSIPVEEKLDEIIELDLAQTNTVDVMVMDSMKPKVRSEDETPLAASENEGESLKADNMHSVISDSSDGAVVQTVINLSLVVISLAVTTTLVCGKKKNSTRVATASEEEEQEDQEVELFENVDTSSVSAKRRPVEMSDVEVSCSTAMSSYQEATDEVESQQKRKSKKSLSRRESLASSSSDLSNSLLSPSYGSFTSYGMIPSRHRDGLEEMMVTPIRRSSRLRK